MMTTFAWHLLATVHNISFRLPLNKSKFMAGLNRHDMKDSLLIFLCAFIFCSCKTEKGSDVQQQESNTLFEIHRGTNIAHWLSQSERRGEERAGFFTQKDIAFIDSVGFDHIRLPVDEEQLWDETGKRHEDAFSLLTNCLTWCSDAGLRVVLDLHI